jgi:hypothetical protein
MACLISDGAAAARVLCRKHIAQSKTQKTAARIEERWTAASYGDRAKITERPRKSYGETAQKLLFLTR